MSTILIVDDSPDVRKQLEIMLTRANLTDLRFADSGKAALDALKIDDPAEAGAGIDLVVMDVRMPLMDGIEACRNIKERDHTRDIPVIMVTADKDTKTLTSAFDAGASDYIVKPPERIELMARINAALRMKREIDRRKERETELLDVTNQLSSVNVALEDANRKLLHLSSVDGLTGIANRRAFNEYLEKEYRRALRFGRPISLIMADIDYFKAYNDHFGHQGGDECLMRVASCLALSLKRPTDLVARYGGEEFAVVLSDIAEADAEKSAGHIMEGIAALNLNHPASSVSDKVTISLGVATVRPTREAYCEAIINCADTALYQAKKEGRNCYRIYRPEPPTA